MSEVCPSDSITHEPVLRTTLTEHDVGLHSLSFDDLRALIVSQNDLDIGIDSPNDVRLILSPYQTSNFVLWV